VRVVYTVSAESDSPQQGKNAAIEPNVGQNFVQKAQEIASKGKPVFPCKPDKSPYTPRGFKDATTDPGRVNAFWNRYPQAKIGMPTGRQSGVFVVDVDRPEALSELEHELLPETLTICTPSGGRHFYFEYAEGVTNSPGGIPAGIDIRGEGGYVILPPSPGYTVERKAPIAQAPQRLLDMIRTKPLRRAAAESSPSENPMGPIDLASTDPIPEGGRNNTLASIGGWLRSCGFEQPEIEQALLNVNEKRCDPPLELGEVRRIAWSVSRYEKRKGATPPDADTLAAVDASERALWDSPWPKIGGKSERSIAVMLIKLARRFGRLLEDGSVAVDIGHRPLALVCATSRLSLRRAIERSDWFRQGDKGEGRNAGTIILVGRAKVTHSNHRGAIEGQGNVCGLPLRAPFSAPRLRWSAPDNLRLGKTCEAVIDYLERAGGSLPLADLAESMHVSRIRDFRRRNIARLEERGIVEVCGDTVSLVENWIEALEVEREASGEIAKFRRDQQKFDRERAAWAKRFENKPDESPSDEALTAQREAWCNRVHASGQIAELERVPEPLTLKELYALMNKPVMTTAGRGRLWQARSDTCGVVLDDKPDVVTFLHSVDILGPKGFKA
jgi:hypothetical protein